jgi:hypothetical protein
MDIPEEIPEKFVGPWELPLTDAQVLDDLVESANDAIEAEGVSL